ncbi:HI0074 family nucleotidyltransferase substrate-binding subunit [Anaerolineales bacterium HSG6]|nr:HI0074 family nucleotidyltransferase substrate-binding subunit [Anaerolineales bacterium HSG6]
MNEKIIRSVQNLESALQRLEEALTVPKTDSLVIDGTIQRFEFTLELYWKTLKRLLAWEGIRTRTPREALKQAYHLEWLSDETIWLQMLHDRNETSHMYDERMADVIYERIKIYYPEMKQTFDSLKNLFDL